MVEVVEVEVAVKVGVDEKYKMYSVHEELESATSSKLHKMYLGVKRSAAASSSAHH